jgi:tRNA 2-thiouridine synthesizing protein D
VAKALTIAIMDAPYESANSTTALRIMAAAIEKGMDVNVFAYEGALKGAAVVPALLRLAEQRGVKLDWVNCDKRVDERGADLLKMADASVTTLVIPSR